MLDGYENDCAEKLSLKDIPPIKDVFLNQKFDSVDRSFLDITSRLTGSKLEFVKMYKELTGVGLLESKHIIEEMFAGTHGLQQQDKLDLL